MREDAYAKGFRTIHRGLWNRIGELRVSANSATLLELLGEVARDSDRQAHPCRQMAHPSAFARASRPRQQERDGEGRPGAQQVRCQRREVAIAVSSVEVMS
jgi:hypothetical protein